VVRKRAVADKGAWKSAAAKRLQEAAGNLESVEAAVSYLVTGLLEGVVCPPTDLESLGEKLRVRSIVGESLPASGELRRAGKDYIVVYASDMPPARRRFTVAHEFGHILLERCGARQIKDSPEIERLCDSIASEILLPQAIFLQQSTGELTPSRVLDIARAFQTSIIATARRCHDLRRTNMFLVSQNEVEWGFGAVRRGPVSGLDSDLQVAIDAAFAGISVSELVFINTGVSSGQWRATSASLGNTGAILFLLQPVPRSSSMRQRYPRSPRAIESPEGRDGRPGHSD
jgi:hypothetical protein